MKLTKSKLKQVIKEEIVSLRKEGMFDWFGGGKEEEPAPAPEAQEDPEAAAEAKWQRFEEEIKSLYGPIVAQIPHDDLQFYCKSMGCKKHLSKFWKMVDSAGATMTSLFQRKEQYIKAHAEGGPKAVQDLFERWRKEGYDNFGLSGWVHRTNPHGNLIVDKNWVSELELQLGFVKSEIEQSKNPRAPEPESRERDDSYWAGGDIRGLRSGGQRERTPGGGYGLTRENKISKKRIKK